MRTASAEHSRLAVSAEAAAVNVLLLGTGGREHALALKLRQSPRLGKLHVQPDANAGLRELGTPVDVPISIREIYRLVQYCDRHEIGLVVVGPEQPLAEGFADKLATPTRLVFGPTAAGARIEADKAYAKELMRAAAVPTGEARAFTDADAACAAIEATVLGDERATPLAGVLERVDRVPFQRKAIDAMLRIGGAVIDRTTFDAADMTLLRDVLGRSKTRGAAPSESVIRDQAALLARLYRTELPNLPVVKASGLAGGKGVIVPSTLTEAIDAVDRIMRKKEFGDAGSTLVLEEKLAGREVSVLAITDGRSILVLPPCQDHKRLNDGDEGPNTGGMGVFCPSDALSPDLMDRVERDVLVPILDVMRREGIEYKGVLYAGLMLTHGGPKVLEFNCRFGDPECQPLMTRLESDLLDLMLATCKGRLSDAEVRWSDQAACCVVMAAHGYPGKPRSGDDISGLDEAGALPDVTIHQAGTKRDERGRIVTSGGRVLSVTALGADLAAARANAYAACERISFAGANYRRDIGLVSEGKRRQREGALHTISATRSTPKARA
jgi:phosphoribosylamine--glycine ligase